MINLNEFHDALNRIIKKVLTDKYNSPIQIDEIFVDYGLDSLDQMNMLLEIEDIISTKIGDVDLKIINTPRKLFGYIQKVPEV